MKTVICPTVTAYDTHEYRTQMERIAPFVKRVHLDLMDGRFAPTKSPDIGHIWWPHELKADVHLMYDHPITALHHLIKLKPRMVVIHAEAKVDHMHFASQLHSHGIKAGLALLAETPVNKIKHEIHSFDHALIFSGKLGYHGGTADTSLLSKVKDIRNLDHDIEIGWDGGINADNARQLIDAGVQVLNVGGFVQKAENPKKAYATLKGVIKG